MNTQKNITDSRNKAIASAQEHVEQMFLGKVDENSSIYLYGEFCIGGFPPNYCTDLPAYDSKDAADDMVHHVAPDVREKDPTATNVCYLDEFIECRKGTHARFETYTVWPRNGTPYIYTVTTFRQDGSQITSPSFSNFDEWKKYHTDLWHQYDESGEARPIELFACKTYNWIKPKLITDVGGNPKIESGRYVLTTEPKSDDEWADIYWTLYNSKIGCLDFEFLANCNNEYEATWKLWEDLDGFVFAPIRELYRKDIILKEAKQPLHVGYEDKTHSLRTMEEHLEYIYRALKEKWLAFQQASQISDIIL